MQISLCLYPQFSNHCLANALEPLRAANDLSGAALYGWQIVSPDGRAVQSSSGLEIMPQCNLKTARGDALFLIPSYNHHRFDTPPLNAALRASAARHGCVAGMDTGAWLMARAGLLDGRRATVHWDEYAAFAEAFPEITACPDRIVRDGPRWTCGGATTAFDLVLALIEEHHGASLRLEVAALFMHGEWRGGLPAHPSGEARLDAAVALMRRNVSQPLPIAEVATRIGMSQRRMDDLFARRLGESPRQLYQRLRLEEAKRLLQHTRESVGTIAALCGYADPSAMGRAFRGRYGTSPRAYRQARA
ncbi:GlxA family transcriptional regulator [Primorskyibacter sp. S187A]|uniref:GlxA family transcriptional regulator n=1 Tax=Primorskyibacter sp. S187A TaxID=3415130 RepID=UPI003C7E82F4